ncbi:LptA/OstA family protein [Propionispora hippei]|uniref:Lipopolysaccharide export system protein LptA n=1 Tax=Propionispora hippei DSM 15287 TaxID=1123003 RepID=A0A1M6EQ10_9FIRM|nr:LptA/OstA family protein [Propionispora hippei]SHI87561.1 lipopolysaccharide export system protein LptA [Propionispora hippei DSM 15287]
MKHLTKQMISGLAVLMVLGLSGARIDAAQQQPVEMDADTIEYNSTSGLMQADGGVRFVQGEAVLTGQSAQYNTKTKEGYVTGGVKAVKDTATLTAPEVRSYGDNHLVASGGGVVLTKDDSRLDGDLVDYYTDKDYAVVPNGGVITMPDGTMKADYLEAFLKENRAVGKGNVHIVSEARKLDATSDQAVYYGGKDGKAVLTGNARAVQDGNVLTGSTLTITLDDKAMTASGRPRLVVTPQ